MQALYKIVKKPLLSLGIVIIIFFTIRQTFITTNYFQLFFIRSLEDSIANYDNNTQHRRYHFIDNFDYEKIENFQEEIIETATNIAIFNYLDFSYNIPYYDEMMQKLALEDLVNGAELERESFPQTIGIKNAENKEIKPILTAGRGFIKADYNSFENADGIYKAIVNETLAHRFPLGEIIEMNDWGNINNPNEYVDVQNAVNGKIEVIGYTKKNVYFSGNSISFLNNYENNNFIYIALPDNYSQYRTNIGIEAYFDIDETSIFDKLQSKYEIEDPQIKDINYYIELYNKELFVLCAHELPFTIVYLIIFLFLCWGYSKAIIKNECKTVGILFMTGATRKNICYYLFGDFYFLIILSTLLYFINHLYLTPYFSILGGLVAFPIGWLSFVTVAIVLLISMFGFSISIIRVIKSEIGDLINNKH